MLKRLMLAAAGYAVYRWWNKPEEREDLRDVSAYRPDTRPRPKTSE